MGVEYDITGKSDELVAGLEAAIRAFTEATSESNKLKKAEQELAEAERKAADEAKRKAEILEKNKSILTKVVEGTTKYGAALGGAVEGAKGLYEGVTGVIGGFVDFVKSVAEATDELEGFTTQATLDRLEDLNDSFGNLDKSVLILKSSVATQLAPSVGRFTNIMIGAIGKTNEWIDALDDLSDSDAASTLEKIGETGARYFSFGLSDKIKTFFETLEEGGEAAQEDLETRTQLQEEYQAAVDEGIELVKQWEKEEEDRKNKAIKAAEDRKKAEDKAHEARVKAVEEGAEIERDRIEAQRQNWQEYYDWLRGARLDDLQQAADDAAEFIEQAAEAQEEATEQWVEDQQARRDAAVDAAFQIVDAWSAATQQIADMIQESSAQDLERLDMREKRTKRALRSATEDERDRLEARLDGIREEEEEERKAARAAFATSQVAATASVIASSAAAFMGLLASLSGLGFGAPIAAGAIVGPATAAQLAVIGRNKPPAHSGAAFGADEFYVGDQMVRQGEGAVIFNQRATEQGAVERAAAMNRADGAGRAGGSPAAVQLVLADAGRVIGQAAIRESGRSGSPLRKAFGKAPKGSIDPYRRR
jgi:hypothetical protein